jgi:hypothetical protein
MEGKKAQGLQGIVADEAALQSSHASYFSSSSSSSLLSGRCRQKPQKAMTWKVFALDLASACFLVE